MDYGFITLLPTILVLGLALWSRRTLESVLAGALAAFFIMEGLGFLDAMAQATLATLMTEDVAWVMLVCGLYGGFIALLVKGGGSYALGRADQSYRDQAWRPPGDLELGLGDFSG